METVRDFEYCLVGNIVEKHYFGQDKEIKYGSKHFSGGAKVYIFPMFGGCGHEQIRVIGIPRKRYKMLDVIIPSKHLINVRVKKIYKPDLKEKIAENFYYSWWKEEGDNELNSIIKFAESINNYNKEHYQI